MCRVIVCASIYNTYIYERSVMRVLSPRKPNGWGKLLHLAKITELEHLEDVQLSFSMGYAHLLVEGVTTVF